MIGAGAAALVGTAVLGTSVLSGIFGMAGGMILLGVLLTVLDVAPAMVLFGVIQLAANGWRAVLWRAYVQWRIVLGYAIGSLAMFALVQFIAFVPDKATLYISLGLLPFAVDFLPRSLQPSITRKGAPVFCGALIMLLNVLAGVAGSIFDVFFQQSSLDRKTIVATKAAAQSIAHVLRIAYFGTFLTSFDGGLALWLYAACIGLAFLGTSLAAMVLHRMSEGAFRRWSRFIIRSVSLIYVGRGLWLLMAG